MITACMKFKTKLSALFYRKKVIHIIHKDSGCPTPLAKVASCENEELEPSIEKSRSDEQRHSAAWYCW